MMHSLMILLIYGQCESTFVEPETGSLDILSKVRHIVESVQTIADGIQSTEKDMTRDKLGDLLRPFKEICNQIDETERKYSLYMERVIRDRYTPTITEIVDVLEHIDWNTDRYSYIRSEVNGNYFEVDTLTSYSEWAISLDSLSVERLINKVHLMLTYDESEHVLNHLAHNYEESNVMCKTMKSSQQYLYTLYTYISLVELKAYVMMEFAFVILRLCGQGNFTHRTEKLRWDLGNSTENAYILLRKVMKEADRTVWRCDPKIHIPHETYDEVTRLLQGYIENEVDLSTEGTCSKTCAFYNNARSEGCYNNLYCAEQPKCTGNVYNCQFVESDMTVCQAPSWSSRRYDYIEYENGRLLGKKKTCERGNTNKVESWHRWIFWQCSYCFCLCDEQGLSSDRYFSLQESSADVEDNKVVTGLRFVKKNRTFHLQVQQGKLQPRGEIDGSTLGWKSFDRYYIFDGNRTEGVDYHTMNYSSRSIDLDDLMKTDDNSFVVTGVRFRVKGSHLNLMARLCKFDFITGKLLEPEVNCVWQSNDDENREKLILDNLDVPTRSIKQSLPQTKHNQYLEFVNSGMDKDAAQTTVPFIDIQDVISDPPVPLAGIGMYYKSSPGYGGFVAPKIITYDLSQHFKVTTETTS